jgi:hypothetical protein
MGQRPVAGVGARRREEVELPPGNSGSRPGSAVRVASVPKWWHQPASARPRGYLTERRCALYALWPTPWNHLLAIALTLSSPRRQNGRRATRQTSGWRWLSSWR